VNTEFSIFKQQTDHQNKRTGTKEEKEIDEA